MKEQWVDFVKQFDKNVLEADRSKRLNDRQE
jgi:hypothetical protein